MTDRERWTTCTDPAWMLSALGDKAGEMSKLFLFASACRDEAKITSKSHQNYAAYNLEVVVAYWLHAGSSQISKESRCNIIRCLWPSPFIERERVECEKCSGGFIRDRYFADNDKIDPICRDCNGEGFMPCMLHPIIDPRWRTSLVMGLVRQVRGDWACSVCKLAKKQNVSKCVCGSIAWSSEPNPDLSPILSDALMDAGCDMPEIIEHLKCGVHVARECWVVRGLLEQNSNR